jgi:hypothetical protein
LGLHDRRFVLDIGTGRRLRTAVFITWDEDNGGSANHITTLVLSPFTRPGTQAVARYHHYSMLRTTEDLLGMDEFLGEAATAASMREDFHLLGSTR